ncbi:hypothetical protein BDD12DRAFT_805711 [Trichophaea hybrida]|nr:hypothetical protein BDD12DRAFT_805711 [Trichophaea hybrida]
MDTIQQPARPADLDVKAGLTQQLEGRFPVSRYDYDGVFVLVIYWEESDHVGFETEARQVHDLFVNDFRYHVQLLAIPAVKSHSYVELQIIDLLHKNDHSSHLLIVYYGGHGDRDDGRNQKNQLREKRSVWAGCQRGGTTVNWYEIQPRLEKAEADVLILLDCCYAAQAGRGREQKEPNRCELLAACAMGVPTPAPGPRSFTTAVIREMKIMLSNSDEVVITELNRRLHKQESKVAQSPVHIDLRGASRRRSIRLQPRIETAIEPIPQQHQQDYVKMKVSAYGLADTYPELAKWLKTDPPRNISAIEIEEAVWAPKRMHDFMYDKSLPGEEPIYNRLAEVERDDVDRSWRSMENFFSTISGAKNVIGVALGQGETAFRHLQVLTSTFRGAILRSLSSLPEFDEAEQIEKLVHNEQVQAAGLSEPLQIRKIIVTSSPPSDDLKIDCAPFKSQSSNDVLPDGTPVFIEYKDYIKEDRFRHGQDLAYVARIEKLARLLNIPTTKFHTLKCMHWFEEREKSRFGLVFEIPHVYESKLKSLKDVIQNEKGALRPSLGERFRIAYELGLALEEWHSVNWVHQSICSPKVLFLQPKSPNLDTTNWDYSSPFLGGFEYARPNTEPSTPRRVEDFEVNVYRHPSRQGIPTEQFHKEHDLYSYGVLLLEIGLWQLATDLFKQREVRSEVGIKPKKLREDLLRNAKTRLPLYMGKDYMEAVCMCLSGDFGVEVDDKAQTHLRKAFHEKVIDVLAGGLSLR